jgi:hypothetical protein
MATKHCLERAPTPQHSYGRPVETLSGVGLRGATSIGFVKQNIQGAGFRNHSANYCIFKV